MANSAKTAAASPICRATPGHRSRPMLHQIGYGEQGDGPVQPVGDRPAAPVADRRPQQGRGEQSDEKPGKSPLHGDQALDGTAFETVTGAMHSQAFDRRSIPADARFRDWKAADGWTYRTLERRQRGGGGGARQPALRRRPRRLHREISRGPGSLAPLGLERHRLRLARAGRLAGRPARRPSRQLRHPGRRSRRPDRRLDGGDSRAPCRRRPFDGRPRPASHARRPASADRRRGAGRADADDQQRAAAALRRAVARLDAPRCSAGAGSRPGSSRRGRSRPARCARPSSPAAATATRTSSGGGRSSPASTSARRAGAG